ncbi:MAG: hypothetical protein ACRDS1_06750 [Pseudonocardiaceae bacterium]
MTPALVIVGLIILVLGMCIGAGINREYGRAWEVKARRWEAEARRADALMRDYAVELERLDEPPMHPAPALAVAPVVHVHLTTPGVPAWAQPPVVDARVVRALPTGQDRDGGVG